MAVVCLSLPVYQEDLSSSVVDKVYAELDDLLNDGYRIIHSQNWHPEVETISVIMVLHKVNAPYEVADVVLTEAGKAALESEKTE